MKTKNKVMMVVGAVIFALALAGVLYGVLTHKEPGFLQGCWMNGNLQLSGCTKAVDIKWKKSDLPIRYFIDFDEYHNKNYRESVTKAAKLWNSEIGTKLFALVDTREEAKLVVSWGSKGHDDVAGHVTFFGKDSITSASLQLVEATDVHAVYVFAAHEFGHVLGLAHDDHAIMQPTHPGMTKTMKFVLPSDYDRKILKAEYAK